MHDVEKQCEEDEDEEKPLAGDLNVVTPHKFTKSREGTN